MTEYKTLDPYLDKYFRGMQGFFLEIGCWDGIDHSNSFSLEQQGWRGLCVDPFPKNFAGRKADLCIQAISSNGEPRSWLKVGIDRRDGGEVSYFSGFEETVKAGRHWDLIREYCTYEIVQVETITMERLYEKYSLPSFIDFLSVDTEGAELEIFSGIDFDANRFGMIVYEHNENENVRKHLGSLLTRNGYTFVDNLGLDDVYAWKALYLWNL